MVALQVSFELKLLIALFSFRSLKYPNNKQHLYHLVLYSFDFIAKYGGKYNILCRWAVPKRTRITGG